MVDDRTYRFLTITALVVVLGWVGWTFYDGFVRSRSAETVALEAAHKAYADGHYERARDGYAEVLETSPDMLDARRGLARTLMELGRHEASLQAFNSAIEDAPDYGASYANRGILHDRMGRHEQALADYRKAMELNPELDEGPGWLTLFLRNQPDPPPTIGDRADYLAEQLSKPPEERVLRVPEKDAKQESYRVDE